MKLQKTEKGRSEIAPGVRTLGQRERTFLLLADGSRTISEIGKVVTGDVGSLAQKLMDEGYLHEAASHRSTKSSVSSVHASEKSTVKATVSPLHQPPLSATDQFDGRRSLATTRMFLFDISERMFARKAPELATQFREDLRNAKDRESMLDVSRSMLTEVERIAGASRADSISERLAMLLPAEP